MADLLPGFEPITPPVSKDHSSGLLPGFEPVPSSSVKTLPATAPAAPSEYPKTPQNPLTAFSTKPMMDPVFHTLVAPVINAIDYPVRAGVADIAASIPGIGALPTDKGSRETWQRVRDRIIGSTALPETSTGQTISKIAGIPGEMIQKGVRAASESILGKDTTNALSPVGQAAMDVLPFGVARLGKARGAAPLSKDVIPTPQAQQAHAAGYLLAPEEVSERPSRVSRLVSAISGKDKKFQTLSKQNERVTDDLAAAAIGLPKGTALTEAAFEKAKQPAVNAYREFEKEVPNVVTGADPAFRQGVDKIGTKGEELEREYPEAAHDPSIVELREQLLRQPLNSMAAVKDKISDLRLEAGKNFRNPFDNHARVLGAAQRQAATLLEDQVERSIAYGPDHIAALHELHQALEQRAAASRALAGEKVSAPGGIPAADARIAQAQARVKQTAGQLDPARAARAKELIDNFRQARQLFAKVFDVQLATNASTGHVVARRIANLRNKRPLTGELKDIADAYDAFPRSLKESAKAGGVEDWSILDAWGMATSLAHGHPLVAAGIAARPAVRSGMLTSPSFQERMFNPSRPISTPTSGYAAGVATEPPSPDPLNLSWRYGMPQRPIAPPQP